MFLPAHLPRAENRANTCEAKVKQTFNKSALSLRISKSPETISVLQNVESQAAVFSRCVSYGAQRDERSYWHLGISLSVVLTQYTAFRQGSRLLGY